MTSRSAPPEELQNNTDYIMPLAVRGFREAEMDEQLERGKIAELTTEIVTAYVSSLGPCGSGSPPGLHDHGSWWTTPFPFGSRR